MKVTVDGIDAVMQNLKRELQKINGDTLSGMVKASIIVRRSMEAEEPKIPIDTGNLRASWFTVTSKGATTDPGKGFKGPDASPMSSQHSSVMSKEKAAIASRTNPNVSMGFTANYTLSVHENTEATYKRPGSGPKFLEKAIIRNRKQMIDVIAASAKIDK